MHDRRHPYGLTIAVAIGLAIIVTYRFVLPPAPPADAAAPVRMLLGWSGDPATTRAVTWRTAASLDNPQAQMGPASSGDAPAGPTTTLKGSSRVIRLDDGRTVGHHRVEFTGLRPATRYAYRVGDGHRSSNWHVFTTASGQPDPFRFVYLGDAQHGLTDQWPQVVAAARAAAPDAAFVVHAGDLLAEGYDDSLWGAWVSGMQQWSFSTPNVAVPGNHDLHRSPSVDASGAVYNASALWTAHFALPSNGPPELGDLTGQSYYLDYQGVRLVAIDVNAFSNDDYVETARERVRAAQTAWLRRVLETRPGGWTVVVQHQPVFPVVKGRDLAKMRAALEPIYDQYHVDLVLQGHDHIYARTHKVRAGRLVAPGDAGTVYATAVSGPKMYSVTSLRPPLMALIREGTPTYQVVSVTPVRLSYESRTVDGTLVDAFDLVRGPGAASTYVDRAPSAHRSR